MRLLFDENLSPKMVMALAEMALIAPTINKFQLKFKAN